MESSLHRIFFSLFCVAVMSGCAGQGDADVPPDRGDEVYAEYCMRCHGEAGEGAQDGVPDIRGRALWKANTDTLLFILLFGMDTQYSSDSVHRTMPPIPYGDEDVADVASYVSDLIGGNPRTFTAEDVQRVRDRHKRQLLQRLSQTIRDE